MSLSYFQIKQICQEIAPRIVGRVLYQVFELPCRKFIFNFGGEFLLICLQDPFLRLHLTNQKGRAQTLGLTKKMQENLQNAPLIELKILNDDRIISLEFKNYSVVVELFPKRPNLFLLSKDKTILDSLNPNPQTNYELPLKKIQSEENVSDVTSRSIENHYRDLEREAEFHLRKQAILKRFTIEKKRLQSRLIQSELDLKNAEEWVKWQHEALLLQANFFQLKKGLTTISLNDWEEEGKVIHYSLDPSLTPQEEVEKRFRIIRKQKASIPYILKEMEKQRQRLLRVEDHLQKVTLAQTVEDLKSFEENKEKVASSCDLKNLPYREYTSSSGLKIWVGKSAAKNDLLTFRYARGSDWWMHASGFPGSHVVLRVNKNEEPDEEAVKDAIQLALYYSKAKDQGYSDVCITQRKYVARLGKNAPGKVQISKHKIVHAKIDADRFARLKENK